MFLGIGFFLFIVSLVLIVGYLRVDDKFKPENKILGICALLTFSLSAISFIYQVHKDNLENKINNLTTETELISSEPTSEIVFEEEVGEYLYKMNYLRSSRGDESAFNVYDNVKDNLGNTYENGLGGVDNYDENWQEYKLNKAYKKISGKIVLNYDVRSKSYDATYVKIYGDDIPLLVSDLVSSGQMPQTFDIDVSNIDILKIVIVGEEAIRIVDFGLYKTNNYSSFNTMIASKNLDGSKKYLFDLDYFNSSKSNGNSLNYVETPKDNLGATYSNGLVGANNYDENWQDYYINGQFSELQGRIILNYDNRSENFENTYVKIYGDENIIYTSPLITSGVEPIDIAKDTLGIDISGINILRVSIYGSDAICLVDCILYKESNSPTISSAKNQTQEKSQIALSSMDYFSSSDRSGGFIIHSVVKDNRGDVYADGIGGRERYNENWQVYKLNCQYTKLTGKIILDYDSRSEVSDETYVKIYGDEELKFTSELVTAGSDLQEFSIDLINVDELKICIVRDDMIRLVDTYLYK